MDAYQVIIQTHTFTRKIERSLLEIYIYKFEKFISKLRYDLYSHILIIWIMY